MYSSYNSSSNNPNGDYSSTDSLNPTPLRDENTPPAPIAPQNRRRGSSMNMLLSTFGIRPNNTGSNNNNNNTIQAPHSHSSLNVELTPQTTNNVTNSGLASPNNLSSNNLPLNIPNSHNNNNNINNNLNARSLERAHLHNNHHRLHSHVYSSSNPALTSSSLGSSSDIPRAMTPTTMGNVAPGNPFNVNPSSVISNSSALNLSRTDTHGRMTPLNNYGTNTSIQINENQSAIPFTRPNYSNINSTDSNSPNPFRSVSNPTSPPRNRTNSSSSNPTNDNNNNINTGRSRSRTNVSHNNNNSTIVQSPIPVSNAPTSPSIIAPIAARRNVSQNSRNNSNNPIIISDDEQAAPRSNQLTHTASTSGAPVGASSPVDPTPFPSSHTQQIVETPFGIITAASDSPLEPSYTETSSLRRTATADSDLIHRTNTTDEVYRLGTELENTNTPVNRPSDDSNNNNNYNNASRNNINHTESRRNQITHDNTGHSIASDEVDTEMLDLNEESRDTATTHSNHSSSHHRPLPPTIPSGEIVSATRQSHSSNTHHNNNASSSNHNTPNNNITSSGRTSRTTTHSNRSHSHAPVNNDMNSQLPISISLTNDHGPSTNNNHRSQSPSRASTSLNLFATKDNPASLKNLRHFINGPNQDDPEKMIHLDLPANQIDSLDIDADTLRSRKNKYGLFSLRLTPFIDSHSSTSHAGLFFDPVIRSAGGGSQLVIGRYTERVREAISKIPEQFHPVVFKSKVVSRTHGCFKVDSKGNWFIKDVKSSSGTFLNHQRLSPASALSKDIILHDGDILQLGMDFRGGTEEIYRCVKMRVELNKSWKRKANAFNKEAIQRMKNLQKMTLGLEGDDCSICLSKIKPCQAIFISPCSHSWHFHCIRRLVMLQYPQFVCPNCRSACDLESTIESSDEESDFDLEEDSTSIHTKSSRRSSKNTRAIRATSNLT